MLAGLLTPIWIAFSQPAPRPSFEVAVLKPSSPDERLMYRLLPGGRYLATGLSLKALIANAYSIPEFLVSGGPAWCDSDKFNIEATATNPLPPWPDSQRELSLMLQSLLEDRFRLTSHRETRDQPVYELVVDRRGSKLITAKANEAAGFEVSPGRIHSMAVPLAYLATNLGYLLGRQVIDKTNLAGKYSYTVTYTPDASLSDTAPMSDAAGPSVFTAIRDQLGIRVVSAKAPVEVLVIDRAEKPSAN
jgi:uncharacterized protein (TIGR03435 family)